MKILPFRMGLQARLLACAALFPGVHVCGDDTTSKSESKSQSATTQLEVRVQGDERKTDSNTEQDQQGIAIAIGVASDNSGSIEAAIDKLEKQMKASGLPQEIQRQAMESLRSQLKKQADGKKSFSGKATWSSNQKSDTPKKDASASSDAKLDDMQDPKNSSPKITRSQIQLRSGSGSPLVFENVAVGEGNPMGLAFSGQVNLSTPLGPVQKKQLRNAVSEALEQSGISSDAIAKSLERVDKALDEFSAKSSMRFGDQKPPYRIGVGCKKNEDGDATPGLEIESVFEDSPAAKAGIKVGDRLLSVDNQAIDSLDDIVSAVQSAGEEKRPIHLKAKRDSVETVYEINPMQAGIAELNSGMNMPGMNMPGMNMPGMNIPGMMFPPNAQGWIPPRAQAWVTPQFPMDARDKMREEFSAVRKDLDEIKAMLKKLSDKP